MPENECPWSSNGDSETSQDLWVYEFGVPFWVSPEGMLVGCWGEGGGPSGMALMGRGLWGAATFCSSFTAAH